MRFRRNERKFSNTVLDVRASCGVFFFSRFSLMFTVLFSELICRVYLLLHQLRLANITIFIFFPLQHHIKNLTLNRFYADSWGIYTNVFIRCQCLIGFIAKAFSHTPAINRFETIWQSISAANKLRILMVLFLLLHSNNCIVIGIFHLTGLLFAFSRRL